MNATITVLRRSGRVTNDTLQSDISYIWGRPGVLYRNIVGIPVADMATIYTFFSLIQFLYQKTWGVRSHCIRIFLEGAEELTHAITFFNQVLSYFGTTYQAMLVVEPGEFGSFIGTYLINSVSYRDGSKFQDNNTMYTKLADLIRQDNITVNIGKGVKFETGLSLDNYQ